MFGLSKKPELELVHAAIAAPDESLSPVELAVDRLTLAKRRWRATASDGREFGFDLGQPLRHDDVFFQTATHRYVIAQVPEALLRVTVETPAQAVSLGWQVGNLHFRIMLADGHVVIEDDPAVRQMLEREGIIFASTQAIFQPLGAAAHDH
jgi:urease accessory protein